MCSRTFSSPDISENISKLSSQKQSDKSNLTQLPEGPSLDDIDRWAEDPIAGVQHYFNLAAEKYGREIASIASLATTTPWPDLVPNVRQVLLKGIDPPTTPPDQRGFIFYTNYQSQKGRELFATGRAALCLYWLELGIQIRIRGLAVATSPEESDAYFASRPRESQIGAWVSKQSQPLASREQFDSEYRRMAAEFEGRPIPRPPHWGGIRIIPLSIEFWSCKKGRLHERRVFTRDTPHIPWKSCLLYP